MPKPQFDKAVEFGAAKTASGHYADGVNKTVLGFNDWFASEEFIKDIIHKIMIHQNKSDYRSAKLQARAIQQFLIEKR